MWTFQSGPVTWAEIGCSFHTYSHKPKRSLNQRCSNMSKILCEEATMAIPTPWVTGNPGINGCRNPSQPGALVSSGLNQSSEQTLGTGSTPSITTPRGSWTHRCSNTQKIRGTLKCPGAGHRGSLIPRISDTTRISGS